VGSGATTAAAGAAAEGARRPGAGTGFLSLLLASQGLPGHGHGLSPRMLDRLRAKATVRGLAIQVIERTPSTRQFDDFGAVVERHLMWTLPSPAKALAAWHSVAPTGRLVSSRARGDARRVPGRAHAAAGPASSRAPSSRRSAPTTTSTASG